MPTPIFTWFPDASHEKQVEPKVRVAKFGDGYEQRSAVNITPVLPTWSVSFTGSRAEIDAIDAFLLARNGVESFEWKNPDEETGLYVCRKWQKRREHGVKVTLTCDLERVVE